MNILMTARSAAPRYLFDLFMLIATVSFVTPALAENIHRATLLQIPSQNLNFKFKTFRGIWFSSKEQFETFWKQNSRNDSAAPELPIQWKSESLIGLFWPALDNHVVQIPSFSGVEQMSAPEGTKLRFIFNMNAPCFGIITDQSPVRFLVVDSSYEDVNSISIRTEPTRTTGCF